MKRKRSDVRRKKPRVRRPMGTMHSDTPTLKTKDAGVLHWIAVCLQMLAREIERIARRG